MNKINFYSLDETRASEVVKLPDGSEGFRVQKEFLENLGRELFRDSEVSEEGIVWVVINTSQKAGLANEAASLIATIGGEVVAVVDKKDSNQEGIYCNQDKVCKSYPVRLLAATFHLAIRNKKIQERGDVVIILSDQYWQYFYHR